MHTRIERPFRALLWLAALACIGSSAVAAQETQPPATSPASPTEDAPLPLQPDAPREADPPQEVDAPPRIVVETDIPFAAPDGEPLRCDVYHPATAAEETAKLPAVLLVHGGGWASGDKWTTAGYARAFAEAGIVAVTINYRLAPTYKFPAQVDDVRAALAWLGNNAAKYRIDVERIGLFGYSAGAHLVCMIGTLSDAEWSDIEPTTQWAPHDPRWEAIPEVSAIVGGGAPCEFRTLPIDNTAIAYFLGGPRREVPEVYQAASPAAHASAGDVPVLFIHGTSDLIVPHASSRILYEAQIAAGVASDYLPLEGAGHLLTFLSPATRQAAIEFLTSRL